jgi:hypothetical protein
MLSLDWGLIDPSWCDTARSLRVFPHPPLRSIVGVRAKQSKHTVDRLNPQPGRLRHSISKFSGGQFLSRRSGGLLAVKLVIRSRAATGNPKGGRESVSGVAEKICPLLDSVFRNMAAFTGQLSPTGPLGLEGTIT